MNKKMLCAALLGALGLVQTAVADDSFDDRWYATAGAGFADFDDKRDLTNDFTGQLGFGKFVAPRWSFDGELFYSNPEQTNAQLNWSQYSLGLVGRYHWRNDGDTWWPYVAVGLGAQRHEAEMPAYDTTGPLTRDGSNLFSSVGAGLQADYGRFGARAEAGVRFDFDSDAPVDTEVFNDFVVSLSMVVKLGELEVAAPEEPVAPPPPPPAKTCADMDDDGDGVNNCDDKCPTSQAGQAVGPDGCPVPLTIDLRGVNFDFDKSTLRPDAIAILDEAIGILGKYPELKVEVAGHTDLCGPDGYNQKLSDSRAKAVYDYLTSKGISAGRLVGPNGYGESRPLESTPQTFPACKSEKNRRTELNVQN